MYAISGCLCLYGSTWWSGEGETRGLFCLTSTSELIISEFLILETMLFFGASKCLLKVAIT